MRLQIFKQTRMRVPRRKLTLLLEAIVNAEISRRNPGRVNLIFTTDGRIRKLNRQFRSVDRSTDVLSFRFDDSAGPEDTFGEIYVSVPTAKRQARQCRTTLTDELLRLACHGMLHLFGYDHVKPAEVKTMEARENQFLSRFRSR